MPCVGFEFTIPTSERAKTVHAIDRSATVTANVSNTGIYCSRNKVGTVYLAQYTRIFENYTVNINALCNSCDYSIQQHSIFVICEDVRHFSQHSYNVAISSHNGQLTLHTDSHAGGKDNIGRQNQTAVQ
jgi:hypothetical protein